MTAADVIDMAPPARPLAALSDDALEGRLASLAGTLAAAEAQFLDHVVELDVRGLWGRHGARSAAHWLSWRLGLRLGAARERVRVAHALLHLPAISACFHRGELSYCKVRALTRVATPDSEGQLLEIALGTTGAQLERVIRSWRNVLVAEQSASASLSRSLRRRTEADGSVVYTLRVPPDDASVLDAALERARAVVLDEESRPVETPEETELAAELVNGTPRLRADADAFVLVAETFVAVGAQGHHGDGLAVILHADLDALDRPGRHRHRHLSGPVPLARRPAVALRDGSAPDVRGLRRGDGAPWWPAGRSRTLGAARVRPAAPTARRARRGMLPVPVLHPTSPAHPAPRRLVEPRGRDGPRQRGAPVSGASSRGARGRLHRRRSG